MVFSKGGFVTVPVVQAAKRCHIPTIIHESDMTPGLANKLAIPAATKVCCNFPETVKYLPEGKAALTGSPIRQELLHGNRLAALNFCGFTSGRPVLLVIGGSQGSVAVNTAIRNILPDLLKTFQVIHLCGKGNLDTGLEHTDGYVQFEYIQKELADLFALADVVVSRAGANAICELLALRKPNLLIPLPASASRGDQLLNARSFRQQDALSQSEEESITSETLLSSILELYRDRGRLHPGHEAERPERCHCHDRGTHRRGGGKQSIKKRTLQKDFIASGTSGVHFVLSTSVHLDVPEAYVLFCSFPSHLWPKDFFVILWKVPLTACISRHGHDRLLHIPLSAGSPPARSP